MVVLCICIAPSGCVMHIYSTKWLCYAYICITRPFGAAKEQTNKKLMQFKKLSHTNSIDIYIYRVCQSFHLQLHVLQYGRDVPISKIFRLQGSRL